MPPLDLEQLNQEPVLARTAPHGAIADDIERMPAGSVFDGTTIRSKHEDIADFVVVGTGAAGAVAAWTLAEAGFSVTMVEEGAWVRTRDFRPEVHWAVEAMYRDGGAAMVQGRSFLPLLQGVCVGGSTTINSAIGWRFPEDIYDDWKSRFGLGDVINASSLEPHFERIEQQLNMHPVEPDMLGRNNTLLRDGMTKLGIEPHTIERFERGCRGSARCAQGCPNGAKLSMALTYVPWALNKGAQLYTNTRVDRVAVKRGRASGVRATTPSGGKLQIHARLGVLVAASTIQTPNILRRSGLRAPALGKNFMAHPGVGLGAVYDDDVSMHLGATQGMETIHFRRSDRYKLETISLAPELLAVRIPGIGAELVRRLSLYRRLAVWGVQVRAGAVGRIDSFAGGDRVRYTLLPEDIRIGKKGLRTLAEIAFATGAREVWTGVHGLPEAIRSPDELHLIDEASEDPRHYTFIATHLFGAARMGPDPRTTVVGTDFSTHQVRRLYVVDSSVFPSNLGVNPQHGIMAIAMLAAQRIAQG